MDALAQECSKRELAASLLRAGGVLRLRVTGSSMIPTLWPGDTILIAPAGFETVRRGEIVLVARDGRFFVHRVRAESGEGSHHLLLTRGDCMSHDDPAVARNELLGRITAVRRHQRILVPARLSWVRWVLARVLTHSDRCRSLALRWHARRSAPACASEFAMLSGTGEMQSL